MKLRTLAIVLGLAAAVVLTVGLVVSARAQAAPTASPGPFDTIENHYKCYDIYAADGTFPPAVHLSDQFEETDDRLVRPRYVCNPTKKNDTGIPQPDIHLVCYEILESPVPPPHKVQTKNQFGLQTFKVQTPQLLCLPSSKQEL
jgi:hypothetical protein